MTRIALVALLILAVGCDKKVRETYQKVRQSTNSKFRECGTDLERSIYLNNLRGKNHRYMEELAVEMANKKEKFLEMMGEFNLGFDIEVHEDLPDCSLTEEEKYLNNGTLVAAKVLMEYGPALKRIKEQLGFINFNEIKLIVVDVTGDELHRMNEEAEIIEIGSKRVFPIYINLGYDRFQKFGRGEEFANFGQKLVKFGTPSERERTRTVQVRRDTNDRESELREDRRPGVEPTPPVDESFSGEVIME